MAQQTHNYKKGQCVHLDEVYNIMGLIPNDAYHQDDVADSSIINNDAGEFITFLKSVKIKINIKLS